MSELGEPQISCFKFYESRLKNVIDYVSHVGLNASISGPYNDKRMHYMYIK